MSAQDTQAAISAAITPVVMISANAILISAITAKHQSMADRPTRPNGEIAHCRYASHPARSYCRTIEALRQATSLDHLVAHHSLRGDSLLYRDGDRDRIIAGARSIGGHITGIADRGRRTDVCQDFAGIARSWKGPRYRRVGHQGRDSIICLLGVEGSRGICPPVNPSM